MSISGRLREMGFLPSTEPVTGEPLFLRQSPDVRYRIHGMTPVGDWPLWWPRLGPD